MVLRARDGMPDARFDRARPEAVRGRECGNGVVIGHGGGWESQICHLRRGSLRVKPGDAIDAGETVGDIGLSGRTEFPHVHVQVRHEGVIVDPFTGESAATACGDGGQPLWRPEALAALTYRATELLRGGFSSPRPTRSGVAEGRFDENRIAATSARLFLWAELKGIEAGHRLQLAIIGPDGRRLAARLTPPMDRHKARFFMFVGVKRKAATWPAGRYRGEITILGPAADGEWSPVLQEIRDVAIR
jgi:hypothetical protein